jgi:hypothetical protein
MPFSLEPGAIILTVPGDDAQIHAPVERISYGRNHRGGATFSRFIAAGEVPSVWTTVCGVKGAYSWHLTDLFAERVPCPDCFGGRRSRSEGA